MVALLCQQFVLIAVNLGHGCVSNCGFAVTAVVTDVVDVTINHH